MGEVSLGWFTAPTVSKLEVYDAAGEKLLEVERIRLDHSLLSLITNSRDIGLVEIARPTLYIALRGDGSNLEDALRPLVDKLSGKQGEDSAAAPAASGAAITLRVTDGKVLAEDTVAGQHWRLHDLNLQLAPSGRGGGSSQFSLVGQLEEGDAPTAPSDSGRFAIGLAPVAGADAQARRLTVQVNALPLAACGPWLRQHAAGAELGGTLSGQGTATWTASPSSANLLPADLQTAGQLWIDRLDMAGAALTGDRIRLARVELPWRLSSAVNVQGERNLVIEDLQLRSELARLAVRGTIDAAAARPDVEARGTVDVARLAAMLPHVLRIRAGTTLTSGTIELAVHEQPAVGGQQLSGSLRTVQLAGTSGSRAVRWDAPVSANFAVRRTTNTLLVDSLQCSSEFLTIDGSGDADRITASARFDLDRLAGQLGQFIDMSDMELAGTGTARAEWQLDGGMKFSTTVSGDLSQLRVGLGAGSLWAEPQLALHGTARGTLDAATRSLVRVDEAAVKIEAQGDLLDARLAGPVDVAATGSNGANSSSARPSGNQVVAWPVTVRVVGGVGRWLARLRPWVDAGGWQVDGRSELTANVRLAGNSVSATDAKVEITDLRAASADWVINEPRVVLSGDARWEGASGRWRPTMRSLSRVRFRSR